MTLCVNDEESLDLAIIDIVKKMQVYQRFHLAVGPQASNFTKNNTSAPVFSCKFCEIFSQQLYEKRDCGTGVFL